MKIQNFKKSIYFQNGTLNSFDKSNLNFLTVSELKSMETYEINTVSTFFFPKKNIS